MAGKIVLFGATGYTGELTARAMVRAGLAPVLAGRTAARVSALAAELGGLEHATADVADPAGLASLLGKGDVLVTTVGPFARMGEAALQAAISRGAHYVDSTGEPQWIRRVFEADAEISAAGTCALTAFGYDYVPGNLAAGLALERATDEATRVDVGYFFKGGFGASGGTKSSLVGALLAPGFRFRSGSIETVRGGVGERRFRTLAGERVGLAIGASEHFAIPRVAPGIDTVGAYLGWFGPRTAPVRVGSALIGAVTAVPGTRRALTSLLQKAVRGSTGGPTDAERARSRSIAVAEALASDGRVVGRAELEGPNGYDLTASTLTWAASRLATGRPGRTGALGPIEPFGLEALRSGCAEAGLAEIG